MRKLVWFTIGFAAVCALCAYFWLTDGLFLAAGVLAIAFAVLFAISRKVKTMRIPAVLCIGCAAAAFWFGVYTGQYLCLAETLDGQTADVTAQCTDYSYRTDYGTAVEVLLYLDGKPFRAKLYVSGEIDMQPGDVLTGIFRFRVTTPAGGSASYQQGEGIFLLGYQKEDAELLCSAQIPIWGYPAVLRQRLLTILDDCFPADTAGFARALLLGDRTGIDYETSTAFQVSGISHVIAVSGLHVTMLFSLIYTLSLHRRWLTALLGIPALLLFAAVAGFSPSVTRAAIMMILLLLARLLDREYDGATELAAACLIMLTVNPLVITSVSFQLSSGCMAGIFLFQKRISGWLNACLPGKKRFRHLRAAMIGSVSMTLSAMSLTTPLCAMHFGAVSLVGVLTNLLTLWVVSLTFYSCVAVCAVGAALPAAGAVLGKVIAWPIRYVLFVSKTLAAFPLAAVYTRSVYIVAWIIFLYLLLAVFLLQHKKRPLMLVCCAALGLCLAVAASWTEVLTDECRMTVLDVGQGQCILLQSEGKTYLVDCGGSDGEEAADLAAETLLSGGVSRLDGLILTHFDRDHAGGVQYLLTRIPADIIFVPDVSEADESDALAGLSEASICRVNDTLELTYGCTKISIFGPVLLDSGNESSLAVLFQAGSCDILITGDRSSFGERILMKQTDLPELDVLVVGHHGAKTSTSEELLAATTPAIAVISVGENVYGHPAEETLARLEAFGCLVYRTDLDGNIVLRR